MLTKMQSTELRRLLRDLGLLRKRWSGRPDKKDVADLCQRAFASLDALAHHFNTPLGVCFRPDFVASTAPAALCCRGVKAVSDLHSNVCGPESAGKTSERRAQKAAEDLEASLTSLSESVTEKPAAKAATVGAVGRV